jgi:hypothetical protein
MELLRVKIQDNNFSHDFYSSAFQKSKYIEWQRNFNSIDPKDPLFFTDGSMGLATIGHPRNIGWLMEPPDIQPQNYSTIPSNLQNFERVLTYSKKLIETDSKFEFYPHSGCWIESKDWGIHNKSRKISIISSGKTLTEGHRLRHSVIYHYGNDLDVFGRGYNPIERKIKGLQDYMFSFAIENSKVDYYFTEKLIDCLITGTIPVYFGCPSIADFFNPDGFIFLDSVDDLPKIKSQITEESYRDRKEAIEENYQKAKNYILAEDWIFQNTNIFTK